jgi:carbonic anhydrase
MIVSVLILAAIVLLFATPIILMYRKGKKRAAGLRQASEELGFSFSPQADLFTLKELSTYQLFSEGTSNKVVNPMWAKEGDLEVKVFDYGYSIGGEESAEYPTQTVIRFRSPELDLPAFTVRSKQMFHVIATLLGYQDIVINSHSSFSKNYLLRGNNEGAIRKLFRDDVLAYFARGASLSAEGNGNEFVLFRQAKIVDPENIRFFVQEGFEVLALFWPTSSRRREELPGDLRQRFGVRVAGDVTAPLDRHAAGIRQAAE